MNAFAKFVGSNVVRKVDLTGYMGEDHSHNVRPAEDYRDALVRRIITRGEGDPGATKMPFSLLDGKFEFRQRELTIWTGYKGHGKSLMLSQALVEAMNNGKRIFIMSPEFKPETVLERMLYQSCRSTEPTKEHVEAFFYRLNGKAWLYDHQASLKPAEVTAMCRYVCDKIVVDHILIDSLMKCGISPDDYGSQKQFVDQLQTVAHNNDVHIHLVAHARKGNDDSKPPRLHDIKGASEIADMAENVLTVWRNKEKEKDGSNKQDEEDAILTVEAQRNADGWIGGLRLMHNPDTHRFYQVGDKDEVSEYVSF